MPQPVKLRAIVQAIIDHAPGLRSLVLSPERPVPHFRPGQFLHLAVDAYDPSKHWPESRVFSIASPPEQRDRLCITVSAVGRFTRRMMDLKTGDSVWIKLPYGDFVIANNPGEMPVLVAGGTGITPFISWLSMKNFCAGGPVTLLYGARIPNLLIYRELLDTKSNEHNDFQWVPFIEEGELAGSVRGRLSAEVALQEAKRRVNGSDAVFYLSGPPAMLKTLKHDLTAAGVNSEKIRIDSWE